MGLKPTFGIKPILASRGHLCCWGVLLGSAVDPIQWEIYEIDSVGERRW